MGRVLSGGGVAVAVDQFALQGPDKLAARVEDTPAKLRVSRYRVFLCPQPLPYVDQKAGIRRQSPGVL